MTLWPSDELNKIGNAEELQIASLRRDGSLRKPVIIWVVRIGDELYARSVKGRAGGWFPGALSQHAGHIWAGGVEKDVSFVEENDLHLNKQIDTAYQAKYRRYPSSVSHINSPEARTATIRFVPRETVDGKNKGEPQES
jgi:hypothetical protein